MCGIVGAASQRNIYKILIEGLRRLEYRGYDSAGFLLLTAREPYKPAKLSAEVAESRKNRSQPNTYLLVTPAFPTPAGPLTASRSTINSHPHTSSAGVSVVHNGIIENHDELRNEVDSPGLRNSSRQPIPK